MRHARSCSLLFWNRVVPTTIDCWSSSRISIKLRSRHPDSWINTHAVSYRNGAGFGHVCGLPKFPRTLPMFFAFPKSPPVYTMGWSAGSCRFLYQQLQCILFYQNFTKYRVVFVRSKIPDNMALCFFLSKRESQRLMRRSAASATGIRRGC